MNGRGHRFWWQWPNVLGLDAPVVAFAWQSLLAATGHMSLAVSGRLGLFLAVWSIYLADRILDARRPVPSGAKEAARHGFAREHPLVLLALLLMVLVAGSLVALSLRTPVRTAALAAAGGVIAYLGLVHATVIKRTEHIPFVPPKELLVGLLFAAGVAVAPLARANPGYRVPVLICSGLAAAAFYLNLVAVEYYEWHRGVSYEAPRRTTQFVGRHLTTATVALAAASGLVGVLVPAAAAGAAATCIAAALLSSVRLLSARFGPEALRVLWDVALLSPFAFLI